MGSEMCIRDRLHDAGDAVRDLPERYGIYTFEALVERAMSFADHDDSQLANANRAIAEEIAWLGGQPESQSPGIIHGDLFRDNVLFVGRTDGDELELSALLDFEQASLGQRVYDLAVCVNAWCYDEAFDPVLVRSMVRSCTHTRWPSEVSRTSHSNASAPSAIARS